MVDKLREESPGMNIINLRDLPRLFDAVELAAQYYHELLKSNAGRQAQVYLSSRGISQDIIDSFGLGYAPNAWRALGAHLKRKGFTEDELALAGLVVEPKMYDVFRHRLMFPITNPNGYVVGFGGRTLGGSGIVYINSPDSIVFQKHCLLYGITQAIGAARESGKVVVVEGYFDVLTAHQNGFKNVVGSMGTGISDYQVRLLTQMANDVVVAFDGDEGGQEAMFRLAQRVFDV